MVIPTSNDETPFWWHCLDQRARWKREREGQRKGRREEMRVECKQRAGSPACKKLDLIHTMPTGHEGSSNDSLLGIWKWEKENE